jgi:hypothetical protein
MGFFVAVYIQYTHYIYIQTRICFQNYSSLKKIYREIREKSQFGKNSTKVLQLLLINSATEGGSVKSKCPRLD